MNGVGCLSGGLLLSWTSSDGSHTWGMTNYLLWPTWTRLDKHDPGISWIHFRNPQSIGNKRWVDAATVQRRTKSKQAKWHLLNLDVWDLSPFQTMRPLIFQRIIDSNIFQPFKVQLLQLDPHHKDHRDVRPSQGLIIRVFLFRCKFHILPAHTKGFAGVGRRP